MKLPTAGLIIIHERKLLLAFSKNKRCFYLPGGKVDTGETVRTALCREIAEEMNVEIAEDELRYFTHISAPAYGEQDGVIMEQDCFFLDRSIMPQASAEILELKYFSLNDYHFQPQRAPGVVMVLEQLKKEGYID